MEGEIPAQRFPLTFGHNMARAAPLAPHSSRHVTPPSSASSSATAGPPRAAHPPKAHEEPFAAERTLSASASLAAETSPVVAGSCLQYLLLRPNRGYSRVCGSRGGASAGASTLSVTQAVRSCDYILVRLRACIVYAAAIMVNAFHNFLHNSSGCVSEFSLACREAFCPAISSSGTRMVDLPLSLDLESFKLQLGGAAGDFESSRS